jgi:predicted nucleotidyltransferase
MNQIAIEIPREELAAFCRRHQIRQLALFGSVVGAEFNSDSDVDVLVEFESSARIGLLAFARIQRELSELFQRPVDLVTPGGLKPLIKEDILERAKVIYAA